MSYAVPKYISNLSFSQAPITYGWNNANPARAYGQEVPSLENRVDRLQQKAIVGLSIAFAEWIAFRLAERVDSPLPFNYIEAAWASLIDWKYLRSVKIPSRGEWTGTERGPLRAVISQLKDILDEAPELEPIAYEAVCISNLAEYVLPDTKEFKKWRKAVLDRLLLLYPHGRKDEMGPPVPREAFDPAFDFKLEMTDELIQKFLSGLNFDKNPYLKKP